MEKINLLSLAIIIFTIPSLRKTFFHISETENAEKDMSLRKRDKFFDFIKGVAILAVLFIHLDFFASNYFPEWKDSYWFSYFSDSIFRFAIPLFFICSGILLNPRSAFKPIEFYTKKFFRIGVPYLIFSLTISWQFLGHSFWKAMQDALIGTALAPYYFVIVLAQLYLLYPLLIKIEDKRYFLYGSFFFSLACYLIPQTWFIFGASFFGKYLFFFVYGILQRDKFLGYETNYNLRNWLIIAGLYLIGAIIFQDDYYNVRLFFGVAIFNILFYFKNDILKHKLFLGFISELGRISLWIFLLHFVIMEAVLSGFSKLEVSSAEILFLFFSVSFLLSVVFAWLLDKTYSQTYRGMIKLFTIDKQ